MSLPNGLLGWPILFSKEHTDKAQIRFFRTFFLFVLLKLSDTSLSYIVLQLKGHAKYRLWITQLDLRYNTKISASQISSV